MRIKMAVLDNKKCLVLNKSWYPTDLANIFKVTNMVFSGRAKFLHPETLQPYDFWQWVEKGLEKDGSIRTPRLSFDIPEIIITTNNYLDINPVVALNSSNIFKRDNHKCVYCHSSKELTVDHIIPRSKGGQDSWTNLVTACANCNSKKSNMDVKVFCKQKNCNVPKPSKPDPHSWLFRNNGQLLDSWKQFIRK